MAKNQITVFDEIKNTIQSRDFETQLTMALPPHINVKKFQRVIITAVNNDPKLIESDKRSLYAACMQCAQDGLVPDGREAALVCFNTNIAKKGQKPQYVKKVQYMPMTAGILKKIRNSGELKHIDAAVVYESDEWEYYTDRQGPYFKHVPDLTLDRTVQNNDFSQVKHVFAYAITKDGQLHVRVLTVAQVEKARAVSKAKDGPAWKGWWDGMAEKTAIKSLAKKLPMSSDLEAFMHRDDELNDFEDPVEEALEPGPPRQSRMQQAAGITPDEPEMREPEAEVVESPPAEATTKGDSAPADDDKASQRARDDARADEESKGAETKKPDDKPEPAKTDEPKPEPNTDDEPAPPEKLF